ncbi:erythrocyte membrane protein [Babesia ovata]|uniref:Erythrocyte membrane protein n=1 Tax=Babesia ovata TaxID=189622 RepID=A0A2H6KEQ6_9APIC|nr:erythrocyte membrane protein [Babesia ovata]GBE61439.1 erythrocyte membrane protein [Babesia ovata]
MEQYVEDPRATNASESEVHDEASLGGNETLEQDAQVPIITCDGAADASSERPIDEQKKRRSVRQLKDLMIQETILFMDYRRLRRRFNGIRQPLSYKKVPE